MTRINFIRCDICGREEHDDDRYGDGKPFEWRDLENGRHACSVACLVKANIDQLLSKHQAPKERP